jgi:hypothetical protein
LAFVTVTSLRSPFAALKVTGPISTPLRTRVSAVAVAADAADGRIRSRRGSASPRVFFMVLFEVRGPY